MFNITCKQKREKNQNKRRIKKVNMAQYSFWGKKAKLCNRWKGLNG